MRFIITALVALVLAVCVFSVVQAGEAAAGLGMFHPAVGLPVQGPSDREIGWSEPPDLNGLIGSSEEISSLGLETEIANDFMLCGSVSHVTFWGGAWDNSVPCSSGITTPGFTLRFYDDAGCIPGYCFYYLIVGNFTEQSAGCQNGGYPLYRWDVDVDVPIVNGNLYWFSAQVFDHPFPPQLGRLASMRVIGCDSVFRSAFFGYPGWTSAIDVFGVAYDASQEFSCGGRTTAAQPSSWGRIKGLYR